MRNSACASCTRLAEVTVGKARTFAFPRVQIAFADLAHVAVGGAARELGAIVTAVASTHTQAPMKTRTQTRVASETKCTCYVDGTGPDSPYLSKAELKEPRLRHPGLFLRWSFARRCLRRPCGTADLSSAVLGAPPHQHGGRCSCACHSRVAGRSCQVVM
jgi:hypothetical protein